MKRIRGGSIEVEYEDGSWLEIIEVKDDRTLVNLIVKNQNTHKEGKDNFIK
jgi:hypothetical protein